MEEHHHHHHHGAGKSLGEQNKEHFDKVAADVFTIPWIVEMSNQIVANLSQNTEWIGIKRSESDGNSQTIKMLDYACGNGLASRALAPFVDSIRGMDISSGMVDQYNKKAQEEGVSPEKRRAIPGDLLKPDATPSPELNSPEFFGFDVIVMCMALHHVEDYTVMIQRLSERLAEGGALVIVDWVAPKESGCPLADKVHQMSGHTITRLGFKEQDVKDAYEKAGLEGWGWKWTSSRCKMPEEIGGEQQLFLARGEKPSSG
ncbi:S-adenosyl-L-methionine-dependent methyltransferase [Ilyonectria robusta]|uniref:S-adenosyl-L-methionine-dependent methyltransferase n=1 Tax=Ilyonectria robusta TaxID=1079257 RepID=UPI001E8DCC9C|nr:S-adenosyl-L-methionine-dependent methyltransferase [Ilyonectria robusta]KAH8733833.1 S-adenosyl-L-methionine-dependent methyltransferase [Ilyonectria robusta]